MRLKMVQNHLVLLPGLDGTGELFAPLLGSLNNHFTTSVVSFPRDQLLHYQQLIPRIREVIPWDQPYTLLAESFSGPLALQFCATQPENITALVLVASFVRNPIHPLLEWARFVFKDAWLDKPLPESLLKRFLMGEDCPPAMADLIMETVRSVRPEVLAYRIRMAMDTDARPLLRTCKKPLLYLAGTQDKIVARRGLDQIRAIRPDMTVVEIDAPHLLLQRRPADALSAIERFLQQPHVAQPLCAA
jgi:pimeloyl-ACP methyl ester carboxylesterase